MVERNKKPHYEGGNLWDIKSIHYDPFRSRWGEIISRYWVNPECTVVLSRVGYTFRAVP